MMIFPPAPHIAGLPQPAPVPTSHPAPIFPVVPLPDTGPLQLPPLINFPGIAAGDRFDIARGSRIGVIPLRGDADIARLDDDGAMFGLRANSFGRRIHVDMSVERIDADRVRISSIGSGIPDSSSLAEVVESRENYAEFRSLDGSLANTIISYDGHGRIRIDGEVPTFGRLELHLARK